MRTGKRRKFCLNINYLRNRVTAFCEEHSSLIAITLCACLTGILLGIVVAIRFGEEYYKLNVFLALKTGEYGKFSTFFQFFLLALATLAINFACVFKKYFCAIGFLWTAFLGYRTGLCFVGAASRYWIAKGATMTCTRSITELLSFYAALLLCFSLLCLAVCVLMPWIVDLILL